MATMNATTTSTTTQRMTSLSLMILMMLLNLSLSSAQQQKQKQQQQQQQCGLYMAPSSLNSDNTSTPDVGWGLYVGNTGAIPEGSMIGDGNYFDLYLPIVDKFKTLPYRGQQLFKSWLSYIYPTKLDELWSTYEDEVYPEIPMNLYNVNEGLNSINKQDGMKYTDGQNIVSTFSPGISSLVNSDPTRVNIERSTYSERVDAVVSKRDDIKDKNDLSMLTYSPYYGVTYKTTKKLQPGTELFIDYGKTWHRRHKYKMKFGNEYIGSNPKAIKKSATKTIKEKLQGDTEHQRNSTEIFHKMDVKEAINKAYQVDKMVAKATKEEEEVEYYDYSKENNGSEEEKEDDKPNKDQKLNKPFIKSLDWLQFRGYCIDNLIWNKSTLKGSDSDDNKDNNEVGRGAFAKRSITKGSIIAPAPLLAIKRSDLNIYEAKKHNNQYRYYLDFDKLLGQELLLNYAYGHKDSNLLLVPYTPVVNYINHNSKQPNAMIRWPDITDIGNSVQYQRNPKEWLNKHPLDVENESGQLLMEFIALRDIKEGEEIFIDYGSDWSKAYEEYKNNINNENGDDVKRKPFRHEIGVPDGFYPSNWLHTSDKYEIDDTELRGIEPGQIVRLKWKHNGQPVSNSAYAIGLPKGFTTKMKDYSDQLGITDMYRKLLLVDQPYLKDNEWFLFNDTTTTTTTTQQNNNNNNQEWFAYGYKQRQWQFNMHYIAAYNEKARRSLLGAMGEAGLDIALEAIGKYLGLDHITCFHSSFMGASKCENSVVHSDVFDTGGKSFNMIFPVLLVDGSKPELDIIGSDANIVMPVNYINDVAYFLTDDGGYHKTSPHKYDGEDDIRIMVGSYCSQIDETNWKNVKHLYDLEVVPPFMDQFDLPLKEIHWSKDGSHSLKDLLLSSEEESEQQPQIDTTTS